MEAERKEEFLWKIGMRVTAAAKVHASAELCNDSLMPSRRTWAISLLVSGVISVFTVPPSSAQEIEMREYRGKKIFCSVWKGIETPCATRTAYTDVFIGSVLSTIETSNTELRLQVMPEEVFLGNATSRLTVNTQQGACLPALRPGEKWLFYLYADKKSKALVLRYGSPSKPVVDAQEDIALLRRLAQKPDSGIIIGDVTRPVWNDNKWQSSTPVPNQKIVAKRESDGTEYAALTDSSGHYEFAPLPLGSYELNADTVQGLLAVGQYAEVQSRSCSQVGFQLLPDSTISGRVTTADGKPAKYAQVAIVPTSPGGLQFDSAIADEDGYFEIKGAQPGRYLLGIGIQARQGSRLWRSRVYYPGVRTSDAAVVIELGQAEKRANINFQVPNSITGFSRPDKNGPD
jgi:hypothetical protein